MLTYGRLSNGLSGDDNGFRVGRFTCLSQNTQGAAKGVSAVDQHPQELGHRLLFPNIDRDDGSNIHP
jgi:hypothetical protein